MGLRVSYSSFSPLADVTDLLRCVVGTACRSKAAELRVYVRASVPMGACAFIETTCVAFASVARRDRASPGRQWARDRVTPIRATSSVRSIHNRRRREGTGWTRGWREEEREKGTTGTSLFICTVQLCRWYVSVTAIPPTVAKYKQAGCQQVPFTFTSTRDAAV